MFTYDQWFEMWESDLIQEITEENIIDEEEYIEQRFISSICEADSYLAYTDAHIPSVEGY